MDKIVKAKGDEVVTSTFRRKKQKKCEGYRRAQRRALFTFSEIAGGIRNDNGTYSAKLRIRFVFLFLIFLLAIIAVLLLSNMASAGVDEGETTTESSTVPVILQPEETTSSIESVSNFYISIPGIKHIRVSANNRNYEFNNPSDNLCCLKYELYIDDRLIRETGYIKPGYSESKEIFSMLIAGTYSAEITVKTRSKDGNTEYNSVRQNTQITVEN